MSKILEKLSGKEFSKLMDFINSFTYIFQASCLLLWSFFFWNSFSDCLCIKKIIQVILKNTMSRSIGKIILEKYDVKIDRENNYRIKCDIKLVRSNLVVIHLSWRCSFYEFGSGDSDYSQNSDLGWSVNAEVAKAKKLIW